LREEGLEMEESKQILIAITELQTNVKNMADKINEITSISNIVVQTEQSVKNAHNRIEDQKKDFDEKLKDQKKDYEEKIAAECKAREKMEGHITWLWRAFGAGLIGFSFWLLQQTWGG
jgi:anti-sigma regulatory factor (Ser/Thr protein kinase)